MYICLAASPAVSLSPRQSPPPRPIFRTRYLAVWQLALTVVLRLLTEGHRPPSNRDSGTPG